MYILINEIKKINYFYSIKLILCRTFFIFYFLIFLFILNLVKKYQIFFFFLFLKNKLFHSS
jgi:hypothetical protein